jgi:3-deoxy-D-manno-octulosonic-acid transferase
MIFVKHDVWPNMVWAGIDAGIPVIWINANLHEKSRRLGLLGRGLSRSFLNDLTAVLTVADSHALRLTKLLSPEKIEVVGDSRYDRTADRMSQTEQTGSQLVPASWTEGKKVLLGGSTWGPDQRVLIPAYAELKKEFPELYLILVPHEPHPDFLADTDYYLYGKGLRPVRFSQLNGDLPHSDVLVVDRIGILANLYRSAWVAYVGGAFGEGVHSVLEPAVYSIPLFFGPRYYMSHEAQALLECQGAKCVSSSGELETGLRQYLEDRTAWQRTAEASRKLTQSGQGATERIVDYMQKIIPDLNRS